MATWIARNSDGAWMVRGFGDPSLIHSQPASYTEVEVPGDVVPDPRLERYDAARPSKRRAATALEIAAFDDASLTAEVLIIVDQQRLISAVVWVILRQMFPSDTVTQTRTKYTNAARPQIIDAYRTQPWKP
jgi:hypothetical protein